MTEKKEKTDGAAEAGKAVGTEAFRFFDNREKYLMFVTTCSEKWEVARRLNRELPMLRPKPPSLKLFDAGMGDGTVLTRVLRGLHRQFPTVPFFVVGKEISLEDVRLSLEKLSDRFHEHPQTVFVVTNLYYSEAPNLRPNKPAAQAAMKRWEIALDGTTAHEFDEQIRGLQPILAEGWQTKSSAKTGNPLYATPSMLVIYRKDQAFALDGIIPNAESPAPEYDLILASQPYRARLPAEVKVKNVLKPLASALAPEGRMLVIHSTGNDPGMEIIHGIWPDENPFATSRRDLITALRKSMADSDVNLNYDALSDEDSLFRYDLHAMPNELGENIGTSTTLAAWNAAIYVAQIEDHRLVDVLGTRDYLDITQDVLARNGGLWFEDESFVISRAGG